MRNHLKVSGRFIVPSFSVIFKAKDSDDKLIYFPNDDKQINLFIVYYNYWLKSLDTARSNQPTNIT